MDGSRAIPLVAIVTASAIVALFAGCVTTTNDPDAVPEATFRSREHYGLDWEAIRVHDEITPDDGKTWLLRAVNEGPPGENEFTYRDGCGNPWTITLSGPDGAAVDWDGDLMQCDGFQEKTIVGGQTKDFQWTWKAQVWDGSAFQPAPAGMYTLVVGFEAAHAGIHEGAASATVTFHVV